MGVTPTSARAILHHTDQKGPNIMHPSVAIDRTAILRGRRRQASSRTQGTDKLVRK